MAIPPIHGDPTTAPTVTDHPDDDPTYQSNRNWGTVKTAANSGIQIMYGGPHWGRDPVNGPSRGIGIWKRYSPNYRSWDGLLDIPLHRIVTRWVLSGITFGLRLPIMGMPPREPSNELMQEARELREFTDWFVYATVIPARLFADFVDIDPKTATMELPGSWREYNFSTASPVEDDERNTVTEEDKTLENLYYIQLLRNELPSYHFWAYTDPIQKSGQMRHGIISKGVSACYKVDGSDLISNIHINFNRLQNLPARNGDATESEQIRDARPRRGPQRNTRARSMTPADASKQTTRQQTPTKGASRRKEETKIKRKERGKGKGK